MTLEAGSAELALSAAWYGRPALEAAAAALAGRAYVSLVTARGTHRVTLRATGKASARGLAGEFLDEALNAQLRSEVVDAARATTGPVLASVFTAGFTAVPKDPLEEMDPAVAQARAAETAALQARARAR
ncbi:hypothetical protein EPO15_05675 [bacterium]|nr:MAG: hypothetical protein EPO15_05675 [bacterium]